jgi:putative ABC transport system substrate-binding protein
MRRREFVGLIGAAAAWSFAAQAQQDGRVRRVAVLFGEVFTEHDGAFAVFREAMANLGWIEGRNLRMDVRAGATDANRIRASASELVSSAPDAIITSTLLATRVMQQQTQSIPIIFSGVGGDPVAAGVVASIARPEGNATGFTNLFISISGKWVELLKNAAPYVTRIALLINPTINPRPPIGYITAAEAAAKTLGVQLIQLRVPNDFELVRRLDAFAGEGNGGLVVLPPVPANLGLLMRLVVQHRMPGIFPSRGFVTRGGGLMSYGSVGADLLRGAASYVDRILRGTKVSDLPVQFPTKFELVINLKAAKAIGLTVPEPVLASADEVIE